MLTKNFIPFPVLETKRLILRQLDSKDDQEIFRLRSDSEINKYLDRQVSDTIAHARNFINQVNEGVNENAALYWGINLNDGTVLIGTICLYNFSDENDSCEIGYELLTDFQGKGIMKEAVEKVISYAFDIINVQTIEAFTHKNNLQSVKLLGKLLFQQSGKPDETNPALVCYVLKK